MTCTCKLCRKEVRRRQGPGRDENSRPLTSSDTGIRGQLSTAPSKTNSEPINLFALGDRRELVCVLCAKVILNGRDQAYLRAHHGQQHVRAGEAIEQRNGLPERAVRYLVKAKTTA